MSTTEKSNFIKEMFGFIKDVYEKPLWLDTILTALTVFAIVILSYLISKVLLAIFRKFIDSIFKISKQSNKKAEIKVIRSILIVLFKIALFIAFLTYVLGVSPTAIMTFVGAAGISLSIAFKSEIDNFIAGFIIIFSDKIEVGDNISIFLISGGAEIAKGEVTDINTIYITLKNKKDENIILSNSILNTNVIVKQPIVEKTKVTKKVSKAPSNIKKK